MSFFCPCILSVFLKAARVCAFFFKRAFRVQFRLSTSELYCIYLYLSSVLFNIIHYTISK